jgi:hemerythrin superfamily protein
VEDTPSMDVVEQLLLDHRVVEGLFDLYEDLEPLKLEDRREVVREFTRELSQHANLEEQYLYPLVREVLPDGEELVREHLRDHQGVEEILAKLEDLEPADERFHQAAMVVVKDTREHIREEEGEMLPRVQAAVPRERLLELGETVEKARGVVPTRPHPGAPSTPPANMLVGPVAGLIDRIRDGAREGIEQARRERARD